MKIYRIENEKTFNGMWYRKDGEFDPFIFKLTDGISKNLPMDFEERYSEGGMRWISAGGSVDQMKYWFSNLDAFELINNGYSLLELEVEQFKPEEHQVLFTRESIVNKREIPIDEIWDTSKIQKEIIIIK